ncbi:precorrin-3B synthase [Halocynthiibacter namhaensis]|uniref:precorrin-3B synthase n=1 Tax=Halocynthiibacter namhaensis TaxID=1290553 RepID=UPI0005795DC5|nr:precorrin-3B synthase [Halocynthiibacter namhaensis]
MSDFEIKGWCPGALRPMRSGDGFVVRVRAPKNRLTQSQIAQISDLSMRYGNGILDVSSRANLQIRGVQDDTHLALIKGLRALGLIDETVDLESRRNIVMTPFWQSGDQTEQLATVILNTLASSDYPQTPGKFGIAIDTGPTSILRDVSADIRIERCADGLICLADGATHGRLVNLDNVANAICELAHWFIAAGGVTDGRGRMRALVQNGVELPVAYRAALATQVVAETPEIGVYPEGAMVGLPFGQLHAEILKQLSELGGLRLTPWRMLLLENVNSMPDLEGILTDPSDPHQDIIACTGLPACPQAKGNTRRLGTQLIPHLAGKSPVHISGCAKGCAQPFGTATTLIMTDTEHFDVIEHGTIRDTIDHPHLTLDALLAQPPSPFKRP